MSYKPEILYIECDFWTRKTGQNPMPTQVNGK